MNIDKILNQEVFPTPVTRCGAWKRHLNDYMSCGDLVSPLGTEDSLAVHSVGTTSVADEVFDEGMAEGDDLSKFLYRPIKVATQVWSPGTAFSPMVITPLLSFLADSVIASKLSYYKLVKCDFEVLIMTKGTKFHAGLLMASLLPVGFDTAYVTVGGDTQLVTRSQREHVDLEVGCSQSGILRVPFVSPFNFHDQTVTSNTLSTNRYAVVKIDGYADLRGVNTTDDVTVTVFVKALNVKLASPTYLAVGGPLDMWACGKKKTRKHSVTIKPRQDEYQKSGPVSQMSNAVADAAGYLTDVPVIGPFAMATQIGATAIGQIASMFGFSRPVMIDDVQPMKNRPTSSLALVDAKDSSQKLTYTSKQELTVDPTTVGWHSKDELSIEFLSQIETYLTQFTWAPTSVVGDVIFNCRVTPMVERLLSVTEGTKRIPTALSYVTRPFAYWCGTLKYRLSVIGTAFHNGKIVVFYSPDGIALSDIDYTTCFHFMVDLAETRDVEFSIAWKQGRPYGRAENILSETSNFGNTILTNFGKKDNGCWYVKVVNQLAVADGTTPVTIVVRVSAGPDFEVRGTSAKNLENLTYFATGGPLDFWACGGDEDGSEEPTECFEQTAPMSKDLAPIDIVSTDYKSLAFFGERIVSIRSLMKRYSFYRSLYLQGNTTLGTRNQTSMKAFPLLPGGSAEGVDLTVAAAPYNYVGPTFITYFAPAYCMWRGAIRYKFLPLNGEVPSQSTCEVLMDQAAVTTGALYYYFVRYTDSDKKSEVAYNDARELATGINGLALERNNTMDSLEVEIPYLLPLRASLMGYEPNRAATNTFAEGVVGGNKFTHRVYLPPTNPMIEQMYCAAGDDFSLLVWKGAPPCTTLSNLPLPSLA